MTWTSAWSTATRRWRRTRTIRCVAPALSMLTFSPRVPAGLTASPPAHPSLPQQMWYIKTRCLTLKNWIDDTELEEEVRPPPRPAVPSPHRPAVLRPFQTQRLLSLTAPAPRRRRSQGVAGVIMDDTPPRRCPARASPASRHAHADRHAQQGIDRRRRRADRDRLLGRAPAPGR